MKPVLIITLLSVLCLLGMAACTLTRRNLKPLGPEWTGAGRLLDATTQGEDLVLRYEHALARLRLTASGSIFLECTSSNSLPPYPSYAVESLPAALPLTRVEEKDRLVFSSGSLSVEFSRTALEIRILRDKLLIHRFQMFREEDKDRLILLGGPNQERVFGLGEKTGRLELSGRNFTLYNKDTYKYTTETDPVYASIPFYLGLSDSFQYGMLTDSPARQEYSFSRGGHRITVYDHYARIHILTGSMKEILSSYTHLTGAAPLPPLYGLGFHQSRYSYTNQAQILEVASRFRQADLPLDVLYLDIGFMQHHLSFTYNPQAFPDPRKMNQALRQQGIRTVAIVDPGIKVDPAYDVYATGLEKNVFVMYKGTPYKGAVWPGMCHFPDFTASPTSAWWGSYYRRLLDMGISGFWNDMNEPSVFSGPNGTLPPRVMQDNHGYPREHKYLHNIYGQTMIRSTYTEVQKQLKDQRLFLLTRSGYAGLQRYAFIWTGDNTANWDHLSMNLSMCLNLGLSGVPFSGADIGGYTGSPSAELFTRWIQLGAFLPFMRDHTEQGTRFQEPYVFEKELPVIRRYMKLRYRLLPYFYTLARESHDTGLPLVRPLWLEYGRAYLDVDQSFLLGGDILISPVLQPLKKQDTLTVVFPEGEWQDLHDGKVYRDTAEFRLSLDDIPVFLRKGALIPVYEQDYRSTQDIREDSPIGLWILPDAQGNAEGTRYQDDFSTLSYREGRFSLWYYRAEIQNGSLEFSLSLQKGQPLPHPPLVLHVPEGISQVSFQGKLYKVTDNQVHLRL